MAKHGHLKARTSKYQKAAQGRKLLKILPARYFKEGIQAYYEKEFSSLPRVVSEVAERINGIVFSGAIGFNAGRDEVALAIERKSHHGMAIEKIGAGFFALVGWVN